jgi:hypothetical protein
MRRTLGILDLINEQQDLCKRALGRYGACFGNANEQLGDFLRQDSIAHTDIRKMFGTLKKATIRLLERNVPP